MSCEALGSRLRSIEEEISSVLIDPSERLILQNCICDASAQVRDLVVPTGTSRTVQVLVKNSKATMPNGVLGIIYEKTSSTVCTVLIRGKIGGFTSLPTGCLYVSLTGGITDTAPLSGVVQCLGRRLTDTEMEFDPKAALHRDTET